MLASGQPDGPFGRPPKRSSTWPAPLRHSYSLPGSEIPGSVFAEPTGLEDPCRLVVEVHGPRQAVGLGVALDDHHAAAARPSRVASTPPDRPHPTMATSWA